jgi:outer membrane lipoprotein SlyB
MTVDVLLWSIPALVLSVALLGVRRYALFNVVRHVCGATVVVGTLAVSASVALDPPVLILLGAIGGTLVGQAYQDEKRRAADRRRAVRLDSGEAMVVAGHG